MDATPGKVAVFGPSRPFRVRPALPCRRYLLFLKFALKNSSNQIVPKVRFRLPKTTSQTNFLIREGNQPI